MTDIQLLLVLVTAGLLLAILIAAPIAQRVRNGRLKEARRRDTNPVAWSEIVKESRNIGLTFTLPIEGVIYNHEGTRRAIILKRTQGFEVKYEQLEAYDDEEMGYVLKGEARGYWRDGMLVKTIADTLETANRIIEEEAWLR